MNPRTSRTSRTRPGRSRPPRGRDLAAAVAFVVGAGAVLAFDAAADGATEGAVEASAGEVGVAVAPASAVRPVSFGGPLLSAMATVHRDDPVSQAERIAQRAATRRDAAAAAARQAAEDRAAAERAAAERAAQRAAVWDRLADCESGRWDRSKRPVPGSARWSYGLSAGEDGFFQGGLQFHPVTWDEFRDPGMPDHAGQATREQQVAIAERVLEVQGWQAWPVCSRKLGYR